MRPLLLAFCVIGGITSVLAEDSPEYTRAIKPVLQARCYA